MSRAKQVFSAVWGNVLDVLQRDGGAIEALDGIRALSVAWVVGLHTLTGLVNVARTNPSFVVPHSYFVLIKAWYTSPVMLGQAGVDLFFLLSGFLICYLLERELRTTGSLNIPRFLWRRWLRITPAYIVAILLYSVVTWRPCLKWGWTNLLFVNNFLGPQLFQGRDSPDGINSEQTSCLGHSWSIAIEFQMYLLSPFVVLLMHRLGRVGWFPPVLLFAVSVASRAWFLLEIQNKSEYESLVYNKPHTRASPYFVGMLVAHAVGAVLDQLRVRRAPPKPEAAAEEASAIAPAPELELECPCTPSLMDAESGTPAPPEVLLNRKSTPKPLLVDREISAAPAAPSLAVERAVDKPSLLREVPCGWAGSFIYWTGLLGALAFSCSRTSYYFRDLLDIHHQAPYYVLVNTLFTPMFGVVAGMVLFGLLTFRIESHGTVTPRGCCTLRTCPLSQASLAWFLGHPWFVPLAKLSYSVYLFQFIPMLGMQFIVPINTEDDNLELFGKFVAISLGGLIGSMGMALVNYALVERPCLSLRDRCVSTCCCSVSGGDRKS
jgi:peptidoglycan/LPS O-acetylase OafA/YrhL